MPTDKKLKAHGKDPKANDKTVAVQELEEKVELTRRQKIIAARKLNLQRKRRQKLPPVLR